MYNIAQLPPGLACPAPSRPCPAPSHPCPAPSRPCPAPLSPLLSFLLPLTSSPLALPSFPLPRSLSSSLRSSDRGASPTHATWLFAQQQAHHTISAFYHHRLHHHHRQWHINMLTILLLFSPTIASTITLDVASPCFVCMTFLLVPFYLPSPPIYLPSLRSL
jgi:hypothetical protein